MSLWRTEYDTPCYPLPDDPRFVCDKEKMVKGVNNGWQFFKEGFLQTKFAKVFGFGKDSGWVWTGPGAAPDTGYWEVYVFEALSQDQSHTKYVYKYYWFGPAPSEYRYPVPSSAPPGSIIKYYTLNEEASIASKEGNVWILSEPPVSTKNAIPNYGTQGGGSRRHRKSRRKRRTQRRR